MLLDLLIGYNGCRKERFIMNNFRNSFQQELSYMHKFLKLLKEAHEHCFLVGWLGNVCGGRVLPGARRQFGRLIDH
jgi:hypothetical protein